MARVSKAQIKEALEKNAGIISHAAAALHITPQGLRKRIVSNPELKQFQEDFDNLMVDMAEGVMIKKIKNDDLNAAMFILKTKGKGRGYVEKQEVEHSGELNIVEQRKKVKGIIGKYEKYIGPAAGAALPRKRNDGKQQPKGNS